MNCGRREGGRKREGGREREEGREGERGREEGREGGRDERKYIVEQKGRNDRGVEGEKETWRVGREGVSVSKMDGAKGRGERRREREVWVKKEAKGN